MSVISFSLETVQQYKKQELEQLGEEWRELWRQAELQRQAVSTLEGSYFQNAERFRRESAAGLSLRDLQAGQQYLGRLARDLEQARSGFQQASRAAESKRGELVQVKQEISSMDKLRERRETEYLHAQNKKEERSLEEFVMNRRLSRAVGFI